MTGVEVGGTVVATYTYDALGRRIGINDNGSQIWTVYNGTSPDALPPAQGSWTGGAVDQLLARTSAGGSTAWYLTDKLGSVRDIVSSSGNELDHVVYDSFGTILSESSPRNGDRFKFAGMEYDAVTGKYYDRARYYDAAIGRFMGQDSKGFAAGDPNLYGYVGNSPTDATDPSGMIGVFYPPVFTRPVGWPFMQSRPEGPKWEGPWGNPADPNKKKYKDPSELPNNTGGTYPTSIHWTPDPGVGTQEQWDWWKKNWLPYKKWVLNQRAQQQEQQYQAALQAAAQMQAELNAIMAAQQAEFAAGVQWLQNIMQQQLKWAQIYLQQAQAHLRNPLHTRPPSLPGIIGGSHPGGHGTAVGPGAVAGGGGGAVGSAPFSPKLPGSQGTP